PLHPFFSFLRAAHPFPIHPLPTRRSSDLIREISNTPILFLSSRDNPMDQVMSMELGADDYVQKPFNTNVLIAKLQAIYRRVYQFSLDEKRVITWQEATLDLTKDRDRKSVV